MSKVRTRALLSMCVAMLLACVTGPARAQDYETADLIPAALEVYNERAADPLPFLTSSQISDLVGGEVVRVRRRDPRDGDDGPERVTGFILLQRPRMAAWLAALDPDFPDNSMLTEVRLMHDETGHSMWYQYLSLPWPITDRHWVVALEKDLAIARDTEGFVWAHQWDLAPGGKEIAVETVAAGRAAGLTVEKIGKAIYLPANKGAWVLFALDENVTLLAYRVTTVIGGGIPDGWITTFAMAQLEGLLRQVEELAATSIEKYDPDVDPIYDGMGKLIPRQTGLR